MNTRTITISFVIPAFNEETGIAITLQKILGGEIKWPYEIIVVDNNSTDNTAKIARKLGVTVVSKKGGTIASVRNFGIENSKGDLIVFLDADVSLTARWFIAFSSVVDEIFDNPLIVTGSHCNAPEGGNWIERYWFNNYVHEISTNNLGTGHMITSRKLFDTIKGFDDSLETGEDYSFCMKAIKAGAKIINNPELYVIHRDYPKNIWQFIQREAWHGMGDVSPIKNMLRSKVAIAALLFFFMHLAALLLVFLPGVQGVYALVPLVGIACLLLLSSYIKYKHCGYFIILTNSVIFYLYYTGRFFSFIKYFFAKFKG